MSSSKSDPETGVRRMLSAAGAAIGYGCIGRQVEGHVLEQRMTDPVRTQVTKRIQTHQRPAFRRLDLGPFSDATVSTFVFNINKNIKKISITCRYVKSNV